MIKVSASLRGAMTDLAKRITLGEIVLWVYKTVRNYFEPSGGLDISAVADHDPAYFAQRVQSICSAFDQQTKVDLLGLGDRSQTMDGARLHYDRRARRARAFGGGRGWGEGWYQLEDYRNGRLDIVLVQYEVHGQDYTEGNEQR